MSQPRRRQRDRRNSYTQFPILCAVTIRCDVCRRNKTLSAPSRNSVEQRIKKELEHHQRHNGHEQHYVRTQYIGRCDLCLLTPAVTADRKSDAVKLLVEHKRDCEYVESSSERENTKIRLMADTIISAIDQSNTGESPV